MYHFMTITFLYPVIHLNIQTKFVTLLLDTSFNLQYEKRILLKLQGGEMYD